MGPSLYLSALIGVLVGVGAYTFHFAEGLSYLSNDPNACANCHVMQGHLDSWQQSSHHGHAVCNDCHTPHDPAGKMLAKAINGWNHSVAFTLTTYDDPLRITARNARILQENCLRCHADMVAEIRAFFPEARGGGIHGSDVTCVRCHSGVGHGPRR